MRPLRIFIVVISILIVLAAAITAAAVYLNSPPDDFTDDRELTIEQGEYFAGIAEKLQEQGIIRSKLFFRILTLITGTDIGIKAGVYRIEAGQTSISVLDIIVQGKELLLKLTIPEGLTLRETARILESKEFCSADDFLRAATDKTLLSGLGIIADTAEGYLYPDTYYYPKDFPAEKILTHMVRTFYSKIGEIYPGYGKLSQEQLHENVILASIIEREYRVPEEAPIISSVFHNRLKSGMPLQSCATIEYILTEIKGKNHPERLYFRDLEIPSPYNTYMNTGYPAGPICSPGETALRAAFFPADTDYLFFVLENVEEGKHFFSRTLAEHSQAYALYVRKK